MKKKLFALALASVLCVGLLSACGGSSGSSSPSSSGAAPDSSGSNTPDGESLGKIGVFIAQNGNEFTMSVGNSAKEYGDSLGYEVTVFDGKADQNTQISQIETCITQGYKALIVEPVSNNGLETQMRDAKEAGIAVVTVIQQCSNQDEIDSFVGADTEDAAYQGAKYLFETLGEKGNICILKGQMATTDELINTAGIERAMKEYPDIQVLEEQAADWQLDDALQIMETWLQKHNDIDGVVAHNDQMALGAMKACIDANMTEIKISGRDAVTDAVAAIANGTMTATVYSNGKAMGEMAIDVAAKIINGESVEAVYHTENTLITEDNASSFQP